MRRRTIGINIETRFDEFDDLARRVTEEVGARYQGAGVGSGIRNYYLEASDEHMPRILSALRNAGAEVVRDE